VEVLIVPSLHRRDFLKRTTAAVAAGISVPMTATPQTFKSKSEFMAHQQKRRRALWGLLGDLPVKHQPGKPKLIKTEKGDGYTLEHLELDLNGIEPVPAILLIPEKLQKPAPGLLYIHAHGGTYELGKEELLKGRKVLPAYAPVVAEKGIVTLAIDSWCFSGRQRNPNGRDGEWDAFKKMIWYGQVLFGMMMFDEYRAASYLISRPEVDRNRIGAFGLSMGSTKAWWLAALDPRVKLCIDLCCLTDFEELIKINNLKGHGIYYYVPGLLKDFQTHQINELIVPRAHLSLNGRRDLLTPPAGVERIRDHLMPLYQKFGKAEDCRVELFDCGHEETPEMRKIALEWMDKYLVNGA
jgi:Abhydrolase family